VNPSLVGIEINENIMVILLPPFTIKVMINNMEKVIKQNSDVVEPQEDLNLIKFDEDHTRDLLDTYAQLVKKKRQEVKTQIDIVRS
jgi:hypothetical protein